MLVNKVLVACIPAIHAIVGGDDWNYRDKETWGSVFPTCGFDSKSQSPINLVTSSINREIVLPQGFQKELPGKLKNNGHTVQFYPKFSGFLVGTWNSFTKGVDWNVKWEGKTFKFAQLHFHWGSEHKIDGKQFPLEMHMVHMNTKYGEDEAKAKSNRDGFLVLAFLFKTDKNTTIEALQPIVSALKNNKDDVGKEEGADVELKLGTFFQSGKQFFAYKGSLTTPGCQEAVSWVVFKEPLPVREGDLKAFLGLKDKGGKQLEKTFRSVQQLNHRQICYYE